MIRRVFNLQTKNINSAALILGVAFLISALLGFIRDRLLAGKFGAGDELDIYYAAFEIPDFLTMVLMTGAISAAIIPIFSEYLISSKEKAWEYLSNLVNLFLFILIIASLILFIFAPQLISIITPGFSGEKKELTILLTRIMFLSPIILGMSNIFSAVLRVFKRFFITSLAPIVYNLGIIFGILFFVPYMGIKGLAWGVVFGAFLHFLIQIPILFKTGFRHQKLFNFFEPSFRKTIKLTIPRSIGLAAAQINLVVVTIIASTLSAGSIAVFNLAENLSRPLLTLAAISFSTAAFPSLSLSFAKKQKEKFDKIFLSVFYKILFLSLFLSILLFLFKEEVVNIILGVGRFSLLDAQLTSACLGMLCFGIFAQSLVLLIAKTFYAVQNTKIPAFTSVAATLLNIFLCFYFVHLLSFANSFQQFWTGFLNIESLANIQVIGLPLALSLSAIFQLALLLIFSTKLKWNQ
ncbi:murein biosynthesis integral membrane protein MurJ [Candidatus Parcubacteria bacterium]|nr:murein biosynthesis integral membrane protein MurJ [Candidatus Parcubacteria bacterium]